MIPLQDAQAFTLQNIPVLPIEEIEIAEALNRYLAGPVRSHLNVPGFDNTAMDGYAVRSRDVATATKSNPVRLQVIAELAAGANPEGIRLQAGQAVRIMTGAAIPDGADSVVIVEETSSAGDSVEIYAAVAEGENIRRAGSDIALDQPLFTSGQLVTPSVLGVLNSADVHKVSVYRRPRVGVISTGDELSMADPLPEGKIRDSNRPTLLALVQQSGAIPVDLGQIPDNLARLKEAFESASRSCDVVITTGGVSVGDFDYTKLVLEQLSNNTMRWMQVAIKPAKPYAFGYIGPTPVFGLPGNPVSSVVSFELFARPAILKMMGAKEIHRPVILARTGSPFHRNADGKLHLIRSNLICQPDGTLIVTPSGVQSSHVLSGLASANALALIPDGDGVSEGELVKTMLIGNLLASQLNLP
jgi:molybdopterin molybdotransferase